MNNHNNIFSLNKSFNGNPKDWFRFKREFNSVMNASGASKLIRSRPTLVTTDEYDRLDLNNKDDIRKSNFYELNSRLFSSLQLNISNRKDIILIDKCMNSTYEEGNLFDAWEILVNKYEPKNSVTNNKLMSEFHNIKQDPKDTCVEYLHKIESIKDELQINFNYKIDESILVNKVINDLLMKDVDDAKFKIKLQEQNLDITELEKELSKHDSYVESLNDLMSNLDNTSIDNHSSELLYTNFKNHNKKNKNKYCYNVKPTIISNYIEYNKSINNINNPHHKTIIRLNKTKIQFVINLVKSPSN